MKHKDRWIMYTVAYITLILFIIATVYAIVQKFKETQEETFSVISEGEFWADVSSKPFDDTKDIQEESEKNQTKNKDNNRNKEESIFTYLQGPKSWTQQRDWSGSWGNTFYDGNSFGAFGCGLCCLANVYSTISNFQCTPIDMYKFAKRNTTYAGGGAIAWEYMHNILSNLGLQSWLRRKPDSYSDFKKQISEASCSIVLISSDASKCYWKNTSGHYVTIFLYNKDNDTVFLADSGDPSHNRHWIELRKIYKSLKTISEWQYLCIGDYNKENDIWKHKALNGEWIKPDYIS